MTRSSSQSEMGNGSAKKQKIKGHKSQHVANEQTEEGITGAGSENPLTFWDCSKKLDSIPEINSITKLHIYDFDNTLFYSPCPNPNLFNEQTVGMLTNSDTLSYGGWWSEPLIFKNMGDGWDEESKKGWDSFWNVDVENLLKLSYEEEDTLAIIMTGRKSALFLDFFLEILDARGIKYNGLMLKKGNFDNTISYKTQVLTDLLDHYDKIEHVSIFDDRQGQLNGFKKFLNEYTEAVRPELIYNLVPVAPEVKYLNPKKERKLVEEIIEQHNTLVEQGRSTARLQQVSLKKSFFYSAYIVELESKVELIEYLLSSFGDIFTAEVLQKVDFQIDFIPISRNKVAASVELEIKKQVQYTWKVTSFGRLNDEAFAVRVEPYGFKLPVPTLYNPPFLTVALQKKTSTISWEVFEKIQEWIPLEDDLTVETKFGQVVKFRILKEQPDNRKRKRPTSS